MTIEKRTPIPVKEAISRVVNQDIYTSVITVPLDESLNYVLAENIAATSDIPRFNKSPYDGFAIRSEDSAGAYHQNRKKFKVVDHIGAGDVSSHQLQAGEAVRIMTGAQMPEGADAVVMFEQTVEDKDTFTIRKSFEPYENVCLKGEETATGDIVLQRGQLINAGAIAVLATFGYSEVPVFDKPSIAVIATGSELLDINEDLQPGKIRNSNGPMIQALANKVDIGADVYKIQQDDLDSSITAVREALETHQIVITTGGVSVGDFDYLPEIYKAIDAKVLFNKVAMRPGSVTTVAVTTDKYLFGLSGNPSACYTGFELFVKPAIYHMMGADAFYPQVVKATLMEDFTKANPFSRFIRAKATLSANGATVVPSGFNKSGAVVAIAHSNAMIMLPGGTRGFKAGHTVDVILTESHAYEETLSL
ncbi:molybdopterin molybdotransferase MoeA [Staphylococcus lugdunensis]|uniref:Molybdopterin molybdenumtransferase n=1 Tax=Staphylococcus lugdunensis TaxID=28035 RepID=A0A4Q9WD33_STALU|nr:MULTISPECIES: gephyrin-like molybdotransferase Glp [Staphylococcus]AMG62329.1 molybdopterin molybdenumtransferase [Staphylococcus lugdunensis]ARJ10858.1 molybdopterin molybdenumtransferase [Staphylococcus lugdunensis]AST60687.1 molybdopterin molybdenumtransferase MoeA [Staphylococcus lugdunensis]ATG68273.1 molybdopterin molybdenumtransferase MoeA [Staphylococcus lugdunensis]ATN15827.1 molybdopterin molybdenumtransferase MoeA [Staphylococcus lugdunensis]